MLDNARPQAPTAQRGTLAAIAAQSMVDELQSGDFVTPTVKLLRPLAQGGMGTVWIAEHLTLDTQVVVKMMTKDVELAEGAASRFAREAAIAAAVKSPHVVQVFDSGTTESGIAFIVMELLEGRDLGVHLQSRGKLPPAELSRIFTQLGKALTKAHRVGVIHRDIKPDNVFLCDGEGDEPFVKLLDFGTAKDGGNASYSTTLGQLIGTPYYMSPEQILGEAVDHRTDIWSLGVVAYEALTGVRPFDGATVGAVTLAIHTLEPRPSSLANELPLTLDAWFAKACARRADERFQSVRAAMNAFARAAVGESPLAEDLEAIEAAPHSSSTVMPAVSSTRSLVSTTTTLAETLRSSRNKERRTMLWIAGFVAAAAIAAMWALVTTDGGDRAPKTAAPPVEPSITASAEPTAPVIHPPATHTPEPITAPTTTVVAESAPAATTPPRPAVVTTLPPVRRTVPSDAPLPSFAVPPNADAPSAALSDSAPPPPAPPAPSAAPSSAPNSAPPDSAPTAAPSAAPTPSAAPLDRKDLTSPSTNPP